MKRDEKELPAFCAGMKVRLLKSGNECEFVEYSHGGQCVINRAAGTTE